MAQVAWSEPARQELRGILDYLRAESPTYARSFFVRLIDQTALLEAFPDFGRLVPEDKTRTYREIIVGSYRIIYLHQGAEVTIVSVIHGARLLPPSSLP